MPRRRVSRLVGAVLCLVFCLGPAATWAGDPAAGAAGAFLKWGMDARASGLGGAYTAVGGDAASAFWNPAGLAAAERPEFHGTYTAIPESGEFTQLVYLQPLSIFNFPADERTGSLGTSPWGSLALSLIRLASSYNMEARQVDSLNPNYLFSDIEESYALAWGLPLSSVWSVGVNLKGLNTQLDQTVANGWGCDAGALWHGYPGLDLGLSLRDVATHLDWKTGQTDYFPATLALGAAYTYSLGGAQGLLFCLDGEKIFTQEPWRLHAGAEYAWQERLFARAGMRNGAWTFGAGVRVPEVGWGRLGLELDYAAVQDPLEGWDHWITLGFKF